jgi:hypothetical protein
VKRVRRSLSAKPQRRHRRHDELQLGGSFNIGECGPAKNLARPATNVDAARRCIQRFAHSTDIFVNADGDCFPNWKFGSVSNAYRGVLFRLHSLKCQNPAFRRERDQRKT